MSVSQPEYDVAVIEDVMIPMRDGVRLAADIYRPAQDGAVVEQRFPVLLERTHTVVARNTSCHDQDHFSHMVLPVVPP